ncbi:Uncharacterised protein [Vibrio cholerae]|nr:Uncharacterised protein [Vibrio cholerae]
MPLRRPQSTSCNEIPLTTHIFSISKYILFILDFAPLRSQPKYTHRFILELTYEPFTLCPLFMLTRDCSAICPLSTHQW